MEDGIIRSNDYNSALKAIYNAIIATHPEDVWKIEMPDESSSFELICHHNCTISSNPAKLEYRITHSDAYSVPILMFRGSLKDGEPISISYFWDCFSSRSSSDSDPLGVISQMEHPQRGVPYFFIHPCKTKYLMSDVNPTTPKSYLSLWLSLMAHYFNIYVPTSIAIE